MIKKYIVIKPQAPFNLGDIIQSDDSFLGESSDTEVQSSKKSINGHIKHLLEEAIIEECKVYKYIDSELTIVSSPSAENQDTLIAHLLGENKIIEVID
jgi:hypothetical protein